MSESKSNQGAWRSEYQAQYEALTNQCGYVQLSGRTQIEMTGADAVSFLNNLCTNDIKRLEPGTGCEAYLTTVQGKVLAHIFVFRTPNSLVIDTAPDQSETLLTHLDRYIITEDVTLADRTDQWAEILVAGPHAEQCLKSLGMTESLAEVSHHQQFQVGSTQAWARRVPFLQGFAAVIVIDSDSADALAKAIGEAGAVECANDVFHVVRIESGFPWFPLDISTDNLPQEVGRDEQAISFTKGCYLGQETVARLDALGHVNRMLTGVRLDGHEIPAAGGELLQQDKSVGRITSATFSPALDCTLALAYVRCSVIESPTPLKLESRSAEVVSLPLQR